MRVSLTKEMSDALALYERKINIGNAKPTALIGAALMLAGSLLDYAVYPEFWHSFLYLRLLSTVLLLLVFFGIKAFGDSNRSLSLATLIPLPPILAICWMIYETEGGQSAYYAGLNLVLVGLAIVLRWTGRTAVAMTILVVLSYIAVVFLSGKPVEYKEGINNFFFLIATGALVAVGSYYYEQIRRSEFVLRNKIEAQNLVLEENQIQLQELDEAKTRFFSNVSHELRTPLTLILGTVDSLKESSCIQNYKVSEKVTSLHSNALRLLKLIDNLLDLVRFDQKDAQIQREAADVSVFFRGLVSSVGYLADRKEISASYIEESEIPILEVDQDKLEKIILNLLINAVKFTPNRGAITFYSSWAEGVLSIRVSDTGVGMEKEKLENVFNRFWQADSSSSRKFGGVGIGLSLVNSLVELLEGSIKVDSKLDEGTNFRITLPARESELRHVKKRSKGSLDAVAQIHRDAMLSPAGYELSEKKPSVMIPQKSNEEKEHTILIAEDEVDLREFLKSELSDLYHIIEARDGAEALELAKQYEPDLVMLDYMMPEMNGLSVCKEMRSHFHTSQIPVIMLTARADDEVKLECLSHGANDFLSKPFALPELKLRTKNQIEMLKYRHSLHEKNEELEKTMEQLKENEVALLRHEKLSSLGRMSAGIIHEINNPLNYVKTALHMLEIHGRELPDTEKEDFEDTMKDANEGVERVVNIVSDLRSFAVEDSSVLKELELSTVIRSAEKLVADQLGGLVDVEYEFSGQLLLNGNSNQLTQVFINFFQNSLDAIRDRLERKATPKGKILIQGGVDYTTQKIVLSFRDNGIGISEENKLKIFDPFFTKKDIGSGMGLGLSIVHQILERHQVEITVDSVIDEYTNFVLLFPMKLSSDPNKLTTHNECK